MKRRSFLQLVGLAPISATLAASATSATPESSPPVETLAEVSKPSAQWTVSRGRTVIEVHSIHTDTIQATRLTVG